jgi:hypothetical protein
VVAREGDDLVHYWAEPGKPWGRGRVITRKATGPGSIMQAVDGNFQVLVLEGNNLVHYWAVPGSEWKSGSLISQKASGPGWSAQMTR